MATVDLLNINQSLSPTENMQAAADALQSFQKDVNGLENKLRDSIVGASSTPTVPSGLKVPAKIFDPIFGVNVLYGYVITSDFMSFCDYKPLARVGDLVFVVGIVGVTVVAELGTITSGCMDVRNNAFGSGQPYGGGGLAGGCAGRPSIPLYDATILVPNILERIDPCLASGDLANCLPDILRDILGTCNKPVENFGLGSVDDFNLEGMIKKVGIDHLTKLNDKLKKGLCGNVPVNIRFEANLFNKPNGTDTCSTANDLLSNPINANAPCVSEHMKYLSSRLESSFDFSFKKEVTGYLSKHDVELISQTTDIKNYFDKKIKEYAQELHDGLPSEFPTNSAEAINLALEVADSVLGLRDNYRQNVANLKDIVDKVKGAKDKLNYILNNPVDALKDYIKSDPEMQRFFGQLMEAREDALNLLIPPPPSEAIVCPTPKIDEGCTDIVQFQDDVKNSVKDILQTINGTAQKNGLISKALLDVGVNNLGMATGAAGMNPIDSMTLFRQATLDKIYKSMGVTGNVKSYLNYSADTSSELIGEWSEFISQYSSAPRDPNTGNLLNPSPLTAMLNKMKEQCLTLPQQQIEQFALEVSELGSDIRNFNFVSMDPNLVGTNPSLEVLASDPSVLIPASNIGMIIASSQAAIQQTYQNLLLIKEQLATIIPSKEQMLAEMEAYAKNIVQMGIDSLMSLQGCLPPLPCLEFNGLFNFQGALDFGIGFPFNLKIPVLDLSFPTDFDFKIPIVFPDIVAPTGFKVAINVALPKINFPRIPEPPLFPPAITIPTIRLPELNVPLSLKALEKLIPKFPKAAFEIPLPQVKLPELPGLTIPPIAIKLPNFRMKFGGYPLPKLDIRLPTFPINFSLKIPLTLNVYIPIPSIDLKLPKIELPFIKIPSLILNIPKLTIPFSGGLAFGSPTVPKIGIPFPAITIPSLCGDKGKTIQELIADGKNTFNRLLNTGISGGRPLAVANCSLWVSPHFRGWIAPIPCSAFATDFSKCACAS
jgi:hypothetical protein